MKSSSPDLTLRFICIGLGASLLASATLAQGTSPDLCALTLQNVQQICSTPARNPKLGAMLCATAQAAYISLNCNVAPPSDPPGTLDTDAVPADDDDASQ